MDTDMHVSGYALTLTTVSNSDGVSLGLVLSYFMIGSYP
jgi:hypothetical protein